MLTDNIVLKMHQWYWNYLKALKSHLSATTTTKRRKEDAKTHTRKTIKKNCWTSNPSVLTVSWKGTHRQRRQILTVEVVALRRRLFYACTTLCGKRILSNWSTTSSMPTGASQCHLGNQRCAVQSRFANGSTSASVDIRLTLAWGWHNMVPYCSALRRYFINLIFVSRYNYSKSGHLN